MSESTDLTYYKKKNRDVILNRAKDYYENDKERLSGQAGDKYRNLQNKIKKENVGRIDITICLKKKKTKIKGISKKLSRC